MSPSSGMAKAERLEDACDVREMRLTADEMKYLEEPYVPKSIRGPF